MTEQAQTNLDQAFGGAIDLARSQELIARSTPYEVVKELASEESKQDYLAHIDEQLTQDPILSHINRALDTIKARNSKITDSWKDGMPSPETRADNERKKMLNEHLTRRLYVVYGPEALIQCSDLRRDKSENDKSYFDFFASGEEGSSIFNDILARAVNQDTGVRSIFVPEVPLVRAAGPRVTLMTKPDTVTEIPIGMFVSAIGFESWDGRSKQFSKNNRPSKEVIEDYATRETDPPAVGDLTGLALPDGRLVFVSGNSHRVAAQLRHPDRETIPFSGVVTIKALDTVPYRLRTNSQIAS